MNEFFKYILNICLLIYGIYLIFLDLPSILDGTFVFPTRFKDMDIGLGVILVIYSLFEFFRMKIEKK